MKSNSPSIVSVQVGSIAGLGPDNVASAIVKKPVAGPVFLERLGLAGDHQADLRVHGGLEKAAYCYPIEHYPRWRDDGVPESRLTPGAFGENLTTQGLDENTVCVGDIFQVGGAKVQVTQPRQPCFKFGLRFENAQMIKAMVQNGRSGWYLRVLETGTIEAGDSIVMVERLNPTWPISRLNHVMYEPTTLEEIAELADLPGLASGMKISARSKIEARAIDRAVNRRG